ncbi:Hypothetical_protein [Hexamita inflata]|uniref:Hypothetical_protein n=1 Tax=Hexamita inflata TaxID=28002 RepID=A0AA86R073_9EUKA|nr:Hypothetical protein HINF_LOCUS54838 [Hexamita inflata]
MNSILNESNLISAIQISMNLTNQDASYVIYRAMVLSDAMFNLLLGQLQLDFNVKLKVIHETFIKISKKYLYNVKQRHTQTISLQKSQSTEPISEQKSLINSKSTNTKIQITQIDAVPLSIFKQQFAQAIKTEMMSLENTSDKMTDKQRCQFLTNYFKSHSQSMFWDRVHNIIPYKTKLQLKQYFQKSFSQCQYEEINDVHKRRIRELTRLMSHNKPSEIVDRFCNEIGKEVYFRRQVIMFILYLQRKM